MGAPGGPSGLPQQLQPQYEYNGNYYFGLRSKPANKSKRYYFENLVGDSADAWSIFEKITIGAISKGWDYRGTHPALIYVFPNGDMVVYRADSKSGGPVIEINRTKRHVGKKANHVEKIHFIAPRKDKS
jgi:hypothetical protein